MAVRGLSAIHQEIRTTDGLLRALRSQHAQTEKPVQVTGVGVPPVVSPMPAARLRRKRCSSVRPWRGEAIGGTGTLRVGAACP
jgi:hypothetical protein